MSDAVRWSSEDTFIWYINGGVLDGTFFFQHYPNLVDDYEGHVELWYADP